MAGTWDEKERAGAIRKACAGCGAHTLCGAGVPTPCNCCGSYRLRCVVQRAVSLGVEGASPFLTFGQPPWRGR